MKHSLKLVSIPDELYSDYRYEVIFKAYKWDPQVEDQNTVSKHAVLMSQEIADQLEAWAEQLSEETMILEEKLCNHGVLTKNLGLPKKIQKTLKKLSGYDRNQNVRLMRFDFHPTTTGWAVSEVNSDVPGGLAEASILPQITCRYLGKGIPGNHVAASLLKAFQEKVPKGGNIAFVHATSYSDDRQVMQFLGDYFEENGFHSIYAAPDHLKWENGNAFCLIEGQEGPVAGIVRFFPLEWLTNLPRKSDWKGYYDCKVPSCNHPISIFAQSKRLPLIWDQLDVNIPTWKQLLPETKDPKHMKLTDTEWIFKPALGRVGEGITVKGTLPEKERLNIEKAAHKQPKNWISQRMFQSQPILTDNQEAYHLCIGVFTVDGKRAGFYGRISPYPHIDAKAKDIPILILKEGMDDV